MICLRRNICAVVDRNSCASVGLKSSVNNGRRSVSHSYRHVCSIHAQLFSQLLRTQLCRQIIPGQLHLWRVRRTARHHAPVVDRACGARRDAVHAQIALGGVDHVVARIMRDGLHRANRFAGVAAYADLGVDEMLLDHCACCGNCHVHGEMPSEMLNYCTKKLAPVT